MNDSAIPLIARNDDNIFSKLERFRDSLFDTLEASCIANETEVMLLKSPPFNQTIWVKLVVWVPKGGKLTQRSEFIINIHHHEFHRFEITMTLEVIHGARKKSVKNIHKFDRAEADQLVKYMLDPTHMPFPKFDQHATGLTSSLWRPRNKLVRAKGDNATIIPSVFLMIGFGTLQFGVGFILAFIGYLQLHQLGKRHYCVISSGKPTQDPRQLIRLDSWQVSVEGLAQQKEPLAALIIQQLKRSILSEIQIQDETIWHWGIDGKEERKQTVIRFRRAMAFLHIYPYGDALYIGWDAHLNAGTWVEQEVGTGKDVETGNLVKLLTISPGWLAPNEYDLADCNFLVEWLHAAVVKVTKQTLAEQKIDQEVDFQILREGRRDALNTKQEGASDENKTRFGFKMKRTG